MSIVFFTYFTDYNKLTFYCETSWEKKEYNNSGFLIRSCEPNESINVHTGAVWYCELEVCGSVL